MIDPAAMVTAMLSDLQSLAAAAAPPSSPSTPNPAEAADGAAGPSFAEALRGALGQVDGAISQANANARSFAAGDQGLPLSDVMVSLEQANLALQLASGVRDKVVAAYTNIMNMQV